MSENGQVHTPWTPPPAPTSRVLAALQRLASMQDWGRVPVALLAQATGYSERHVKRLLRQMDIKRTSKGHAGDIEGTSKGHERDMQGTSKGHAGDMQGTSKGHAASLFPTGPGDEICSLVLSLPYSSPVLDPKSSQIPQEPPKENPVFTTGSKKSPPQEYSEPFNRWWFTYPKERRNDKKKAYARWHADHLDPRVDEVIAHTEAWKQTDQWRRDHAIPNATTYLNSERYNEEYPDGAQAVSPQESRKAGLRASFAFLETLRGENHQ